MIVSEPSIIAVMIHVSSITDAVAWYSQAFPSAVRRVFPGSTLEFLTVGDTRLEFAPADEKVSSGAAGMSVYWRVPQFETALAHFQSIGAKLYRGPLKIEGNQSMCQVRDPWGNCIGLRGPSRHHVAA